MRPAIFLDRDGVLNHQTIRNGTPVSPRRVEDFQLIESAVSAVKALSEGGYLCIVVTNQPDLGQGSMKMTDLVTMHKILKASMPIDAIYICGHEARDDCPCRKPKPGMILEAANVHKIDLRRSWLVGDRWVDVATANAVGVKAILVEHSHSMVPTSSGQAPLNLRIESKVVDLSAAATMILDRHEHER